MNVINAAPSTNDCSCTTIASSQISYATLVDLTQTWQDTLAFVFYNISPYESSQMLLWLIVDDLGFLSEFVFHLKSFRVGVINTIRIHVSEANLSQLFALQTLNPVVIVIFKDREYLQLNFLLLQNL